MGWIDDIVLRASLRIIDETIRQAGLLLAAIPYRTPNGHSQVECPFFVRQSRSRVPKS